MTLVPLTTTVPVPMMKPESLIIVALCRVQPLPPGSSVFRSVQTKLVPTGDFPAGKVHIAAWLKKLPPLLNGQSQQILNHEFHVIFNT